MPHSRGRRRAGSLPRPWAGPGGRAKAEGEATPRHGADVNGNPPHESAIARLGTGQRNEARDGQRRHVTAAAVSPGGKAVVSGKKGEEEPARSWELTTGKLLRRLRPEDGRAS